MTFEDPYNWEAIAAAQQEDPYGFDMSTLYNSPYMQPQLPGQNYSTSKWNFGSPLPVGQNVYNQILTGQKNLNALQTNPNVAYNAMVATGQPTMDMNSLMGLDATGNPYLGGGGGGGGGGNGYNPNFTPTMLNSLQTSAPGTPGNIIYAGITGKRSPIDIKLELRKDGTYDTDTLKVLDQQVDDAFQEYALADRNQVAGANQPAAQTPIQEWLNKNGLINPMEQYTGGTLPGDIDTTLTSYAAANPYLRAADQMGIANRANTARADDLTSQLNAAKAGQYRTDTQAVNRLFAPPGAQPLAGIMKPRSSAGEDPDLAQARAAMSQQAGVNAQQFSPNAPAVSSVDNQVARAQPNVSPTQKAALMRMVTHAMGVGGNQTARQRQLAQQQQAASRDAARDAAYQTQFQERRRAAPGNIRDLAAQQLAKQGRTPARDAQRAILNYMQQGGLPA